MKKQLIIIGGGTSIQEGINKGLWKKLKGTFTFGLNYSYHYFPTATAQLYVDKDFYEKEVKKGLQNHSLVIGKWHKDNLKSKTLTTIMLPAISKYYRDIIHGVYKASLVGLFALTIGIYLINEGEIFLLGFDYGAKGKEQKGKKERAITHFYQKDGKHEHRGIGKVNYYETKKRAQKDFEPYAKEKKIKIYNVSHISKIPTFPKISYNQFFKMLDTRHQNQAQLRAWIKEKLKKVEKK